MKKNIIIGILLITIGIIINSNENKVKNLKESYQDINSTHVIITRATERRLDKLERELRLCKGEPTYVDLVLEKYANMTKRVNYE